MKAGKVWKSRIQSHLKLESLLFDWRGSIYIIVAAHVEVLPDLSAAQLGADEAEDRGALLVRPGDANLAPQSGALPQRNTQFWS